MIHMKYKHHTDNSDNYCKIVYLQYLSFTVDISKKLDQR